MLQQILKVCMVAFQHFVVSKTTGLYLYARLKKHGSVRAKAKTRLFVREQRLKLVCMSESKG